MASSMSMSMSMSMAMAMMSVVSILWNNISNGSEIVAVPWYYTGRCVI